MALNLFQDPFASGHLSTSISAEATLFTNFGEMPAPDGILTYLSYSTVTESGQVPLNAVLFMLEGPDWMHGTLSAAYIAFSRNATHTEWKQLFHGATATMGRLPNLRHFLHTDRILCANSYFIHMARVNAPLKMKFTEGDHNPDNMVGVDFHAQLSATCSSTSTCAS